MSASVANVQHHARAVGVLYIALFVLGPMVFLGGKGAVLVHGDAAATAARVTSLGESYRIGMGIEALIFMIEVILAGLLYVIFQPVQRAIALSAALARFGEAVLQGANLMTSALVMGVVGGGAALAAFTAEQQDAMVYLFQNANALMVLVWGLFFGLHVLLLAWLVYRSGFLPRWLGVLLMFAGGGYLAQSFGVMVFPDTAALLDVAVVVLAVPGELAFTLWLVIKGVDVAAWNQRAAPAPGVLTPP